MLPRGLSLSRNPVLLGVRSRPLQAPPLSRAAAAALTARCSASSAGHYDTRPAAQHHVRWMAGHSKWANIRHRKGLNDLRRTKLTGRLCREIESAVRAAGPEPEKNAQLTGALYKAREAQIPKSTIESVIAKASGMGKDGVIYEDVTYEATGPAGVAIWIHASTDNRNRTNRAVKHAMSKHNAQSARCASFFAERGVLSIELQALYSSSRRSTETDGIDIEESALELAMEVGCDDVEIVQSSSSSVSQAGAGDQGRIDAAVSNSSGESGSSSDDDLVCFLCGRTELLNVKRALEERGYKVKNAEVTYLPTIQIGEGDISEHQEEQLQALVDLLEDVDEVTAVYVNAASHARWPFIVTQSA